ncbi:MAG: TnpV protein [Oscillospiraceae bacterium]|nr:TnpV protein [Oscillospiraceae bacterium]
MRSQKSTSCTSVLQTLIVSKRIFRTSPFGGVLFCIKRKSPAKQEGTNEVLKEQDQMKRVRRMNNIRNRVEEIIIDEIMK